MASPESFEVADLLNPCEPNSPFGEDPRQDASVESIYFRLKDARNAARAIERSISQGDSGDKTPDWEQVANLSFELITQKAKDLEAAGYLIEALARLKGFSGIRDGFRAVKRLAEEFWEGLYPLPDEEGLSTKIGPINALNGVDGEGVLLPAIRQIPITEFGSTKSFGFGDWINIGKLEELDPESREKRIERGAPDPADFRATVQSTSADFFLNLFEDIKECKQSLKEMSDTLDLKCGEMLLQTSSLTNLFDEITSSIESFASEKLENARALAVVDSDQNGSENENANSMEVVSVSATAGTGGPIKNRDDALRQLRILADFFLRTEPHSPVSYAINQAVRWGKLSLPDLLMELIPDLNARDYISKLTGVKINSDNSIENSGNNADTNVD
ncbi:MAG: type VI secretion system protein TssA [Planctomycetia bacterium]|jgi:type VI secretion system protein ImpA